MTTSFHPGEKEKNEAQTLAAELNLPYVKRERDSLSELYCRLNKSRAIIVAKQGWRFEDQEGHTFFFHPNMSALRIKQLLSGEPDTMVAVSGMQAGDRVLDCTLGMGADAIVASFVVGPTGKVVALESEPVIAAIVKHGLMTYQTERKALDQAMRAIEVVQADYRQYLERCGDNSFDIVMFDPMFRETVKASAAMQQLKPLANPAPLDQRSVQQALRIARKAVILKERAKSGEFERLGFTVARASSSYAWGIIRKGGER